MNDTYKHDPEVIAATVKLLDGNIESYKNEISRLKSLIDEIESSSEWIDVKVKSSFIETSRSYLTTYDKLINSMEAFRNYLLNKSNSANSLEAAFSRN